MLKEVQVKDLVKGKLYSDIKNHKSRLSTILMFDHFDDGEYPNFKYHSGFCSYGDPDSFICFKGLIPFYELPESEQVNQSHD